MAARAWRATMPGAAHRQIGHGSALLLALLAGTFLHLTLGPSPSPPWSIFLPLIVISGVFHKPGEHAFVVTVTLGCIVAGGILLAPRTSEAAGSLVAGSVIACVTMWRCVARARVGVQGTSGEDLLGELRDGLERRGRLPRLRAGWDVEGTISAAFGHPFSGDFIVSHHTPDGSRFEAVLVDVSGKGLISAPRAVQLSGALDALVGAVAPEELLLAANDYVVRQQWTEGYATAIHLVVDLETGEYQVWRAGHPPAVVFHGGSGTWSILEDEVGPALGLVEEPVYRCDEGVLRRHDALMLYSDGLVEQSDRALDEGIERLLGKAEYLVAAGFDGGSERLCGQAAAGNTDDRGVVLLWRS